MNVIGKIIQDKRIADSLKIEDIASSLKISKKYIQAIEQGAIEKFVTEAYYYGYLKQYLKLLNLESYSITNKDIDNNVEHNSLAPILEGFNPNFLWAIFAIILSVIVYSLSYSYNASSSIDPIALEYKNNTLKIVKIE